MIQLTPHTPSVRAQLVARRTYQRPLNAEGTVFETWEQTVDRVIGHQKWLWERARGGQALEAPQLEELEVLRHLIVNRAAFMSGRTMWLGGTDVSRRREASMTNCAFTRVETVYDVVDAFWLLLQGAGVGFEPVIGSLNGFARPLTIETIRSARTLGDGRVGRERNLESVRDGIWTISIGDSAEAWAKSVGKILAGKEKAHTLVLDFSEIRAAGSRLGGYGWISSGDGPLHEALLKICDLMNSRIDSLLTKIDILDLMNLLGTTLSSRRSAQIALMPAGDIEADEFAMAKKDCFTNGLSHRGQSNNSVMFDAKPSVAALRGMFATMVDAGGSEPGFVNMEAGKKRAPWMAGVNPCCEELLANKGVCNLTELVLPRFATIRGAADAIRILARANYRQTCVDFDDGILQRSWHEVNSHLHLCGVGLTGISQWLGSLTEGQDPREILEYLADFARVAARRMARELGRPSPKHVTTTKPSGCRPAHAITTTTGGVLTLAEIFSDHGDDDTWSEYRGTARASLHGGVTRPITRTFVNGEAEVLRVRMAYGAVVESTRDHPWFVVGRGWCAAESLRPGDVIESSIGHYESLVPTRLVNVPSLALRMRGDATIVKQPTHMNDDLAWLLGFLWGDGCMSPSRMRIRFTDGVDLTLQKVQRVMQEQFGLHADIERPAGRRVGNLTYASAHLWHWLAANEVFKLYSSDIEVIPLVIRSSARRHIISFLAGLCDADANIAANARGKNVILSMASERFATHVQDVAAAVGIMFGRSHNTQGSNFQPEGKSIWLMTVGGRTQQDAGEIFWGASCKCQYVDLTALDTVWPWEKENLRDLPANEIGRVLEVSSIGAQPTYDIEVAEEHWFFAGIYRSHNTLSKVADCSEGVHDALGEFIINTIMLSAHDPLVGQLQAANYRVRPHPQLQESMLVEVPIHFPGATGVPATAIQQLERYRMMMENYVDSNCSITVSYGQDEVRDICAWLYANWDLYVGVSFMPRIDATKTAEELGYSYLPQAVITREAYEAYASTLLPVDLDAVAGNDLLGDDCAGGVCPVR